MELYEGTLSLSHSWTEVQDDSSNGILGSKSSLTRTVEEDEVSTTRLRDGFFLHECNTFNVPSMAGSSVSACLNSNKMVKKQDIVVQSQLPFSMESSIRSSNSKQNSKSD